MFYFFCWKCITRLLKSTKRHALFTLFSKPMKFSYSSFWFDFVRAYSFQGQTKLPLFLHSKLLSVRQSIRIVYSWIVCYHFSISLFVRIVLVLFLTSYPYATSYASHV